MADANLRSSWTLLLALAGCARCNDPDPCDSDECLANSETSTSSSSEGSADDVATASGGSTEASASESEGSSTGIDDGQCNGTDECVASEFCIAPYANNVRGAFACVTECVAPMDETVWCFDDAACCDPTAHCTIRGYCVSGDAGSTSTGESSSDGSSGSSSGTTGG